MIRTDLAFVPPGRPARSVVVFDVLRMTTTAAVLLDAGLERLTVVADPEAARREAAASAALLLGERQGVALPGFDGGNSPLEARELPVAGRGAVLCTTNGSFAVEAAEGAERLLLGAIVNAAAVAEALLAAGAEDVSLVCAGTHGAVSLDDVVGAACVLHELSVRGAELDPSDACRLALGLVDDVEALPELLEQAAHARFLRSIGFGDDVAFAARRNVLDVVPTRESVSPPRFTAWRQSSAAGS
jgi:2-phosphosulfolactate phosphatase